MIVFSPFLFQTLTEQIIEIIDNPFQGGKLRVNCSECGEGAITLDTDPCDWTDVLQPNRFF